MTPENIELTSEEVLVIDAALSLEDPVAEIMSDENGWPPGRTWDVMQSAAKKIVSYYE